MMNKLVIACGILKSDYLGQILQERFKGMLHNDADWDLSMQKITFTGDDSKVRPPLVSQSSSFTIHIRVKHLLPCYAVAVLNLCALLELGKTQQDH